MEPVWVACKNWEWPEGGEAAACFEKGTDSLGDKEEMVQLIQKQSDLCLSLKEKFSLGSSLP